MKYANMSPIGSASMNTAVARERRSGGYRSEIREFAAGAKLASPMPTPIRINSNDSKLNAAAVAAVNTLHAASPQAIMSLRGRVSASRPRGRPAMAYTTVAADAIKPMSVSLRSKSVRTSSITIAGSTRSKKLRRFARKSSVSMRAAAAADASPGGWVVLCSVPAAARPAGLSSVTRQHAQGARWRAPSSGRVTSCGAMQLMAQD